MKEYLKQIEERISKYDKEHTVVTDEGRKSYLEGKIDELNYQRAEFKEHLEEFERKVGNLLKGMQEGTLDQDELEEVYEYIEKFEEGDDE